MRTDKGQYQMLVARIPEAKACVSGRSVGLRGGSNNLDRSALLSGQESSGSLVSTNLEKQFIRKRWLLIWSIERSSNADISTLITVKLSQRSHVANGHVLATNMPV